MNAVLKVLDCISQNHPDADQILRIHTYEADMSDGAIGVLASMSIVIEFNDTNGQKKILNEHVIRGFSHVIVDGKPAYEITVTPLAQKWWVSYTNSVRMKVIRPLELHSFKKRLKNWAYKDHPV